MGLLSSTSQCPGPQRGLGGGLEEEERPRKRQQPQRPQPFPFPPLSCLTVHLPRTSPGRHHRDAPGSEAGNTPSLEGLCTSTKGLGTCEAVPHTETQCSEAHTRPPTPSLLFI